MRKYKPKLGFKNTLLMKPRRIGTKQILDYTKILPKLVATKAFFV